MGSSWDVPRLNTVSLLQSLTGDKYTHPAIMRLASYAGECHSGI